MGGGEGVKGGKLFENDMFFSKELGFAEDYRSKTIEAHDVANRSEVICILCIKSRPSVLYVR